MLPNLCCYPKTLRSVGCQTSGSIVVTPGHSLCRPIIRCRPPPMLHCHRPPFVAILLPSLSLFSHPCRVATTSLCHGRRCPHLRSCSCSTFISAPSFRLAIRSLLLFILLLESLLTTQPLFQARNHFPLPYLLPKRPLPLNYGTSWGSTGPRNITRAYGRTTDEECRRGTDETTEYQPKPPRTHANRNSRASNESDGVTTGAAPLFF